MNAVARSTAVAGERSPIPTEAGIGLRAGHWHELLSCLPRIAWLEVHGEDFFGAGTLADLIAIREHYPLSVHGLGLSLCTADALPANRLQNLQHLVDAIAPGFVSEHLGWSSIDGRYCSDRLPLPYTEDALLRVIGNVSRVQDFLGRQILLENTSGYLHITGSTVPEWEFLVAVAQATGCKLLLDIKNVFVAACNHGFDPLVYLHGIPADLVAEIHLAGFTVKTLVDGQIHIDTRNGPVAPEVWALYGGVISRFGPKPTLIEWDVELPTLDRLLDEAEKAQRFLEVRDALAA